MTEGDRADGLPRAPFVVYNTLLWGLAPLGPAIVLGAKVLSRRLGKTWRGQLGLELPPAPACEDSIWIQAASVGETQAAGPVIAALRRRLPGSPIVLTSSTPEGQRLARERSGADRFGTFPFDFGPVVARYFETFRPKLCVVVETEIWPNLVRACARRGVPLALVNGRISPGRMSSYRRLAWFYRAFLQGFSVLLMQTEADAGRIVEMGAIPERVAVAGDTKYDALFAAERPPTPEAPPGRYVVAGSTHPGESEAVLEVFGRLRARHPGLGLVLAPRHPETATAAARRARELGLPVTLRSERGAPAPMGVLLLDTVGELAAFYGLAELAFVGGSLVPVGGHSLLEPAAAGRPVLFGPHAFNFTDAAELLERAGGAVRVEDSTALERALGELLASPDRAVAMGRAAEAAVRARTGATARTVSELVRLYKSSLKR